MNTLYVILLAPLIILGYLLEWALTRSPHESYPERWTD